MIVIRRATVEEVVPLRMIVLRPGLPEEASRWSGDLEEATAHFAAWDDGRLVGIATVMQRPWPGDGEGPAWQLRGMAVDPALRGTGVGRRLLDAVRDHVAAPVWCNARVTALGFYEREGWLAIGDVFEIAGAGPHVRMTVPAR
jgi:GNAT superfamily N-acetyltransferase